ncbi:M48 family metalloprotease [Sedimentibacter sp. zth1]|uniref:M48 family metalloprotease n=1 Tax=Sedimentibacter sp. zth1 TaxID=2816908 RepID=UPI001A936BEF|nr:M48 family metalloprotease [Sedimentibacter sp. zth1]QSX05549.1 M48 family metalloprotease [Sedimentibacter sp. zth1]
MSSDTVITYEQVRKNQIRTVILIILYIVLIFLLSFTIGYFYDNIAMGAAIGCFIVFVLLPIQIFTGKNTIGANTRWHEANMDDAEEREAFHLVEGLAISAGLRDTPRVYIIPTDVPNAFAGGLSLKNSYVGITRGLLELLDKPETEGVIAHEISHITHRDVLVSTVSIYLMSAVILLGTILLRMSRYGLGHRSRRSNSKDNTAAIFAALAIAGLILSVFIKVIANLVNLAISRKREYMADANAVRICGYSEGIANALTKISNYSPKYSRDQIDSLGGDEMLCMYIFNPKHKIGLFSTHPPIEKRIEILRNMY